MDVVKSSLWREVQSILTSGEKPVHFVWEAVIYAGDQIVRPLRVRSIDCDQDFLHNYTDFILLDVIIPLGTYAKRVYPHIGNIEVELKRVRIGENASARNADAPTQVKRYTGTMIDMGNPIVQAGMSNATSEEDLNRLDILNVQFQLTEKLVDQLRTMPAGGLYRDMTGEEVVKTALTKGASKTVLNDDQKLKGVHMVKASNQAKRETVAIPQGTELVHIAHHIHYHCGGLYAAGLGYYLHDRMWYIYPVFDVTRFQSGDPTLTIINIPENKIPGVERTYRKDGDNLVVVATGSSSFRNLKNLAQMNGGNGVRFANADALIEDFVKVDGNKAVASRGKSNTEMVSEQRENELNIVKTGLRKINANPFVEYSALSARQGSGASFVWENADRSLLRPGMPVKVMYLDGDKIREMFGILQGAHEFSGLREQGGTATRFSCNITLSVFLRPKDEVA